MAYKVVFRFVAVVLAIVACLLSVGCEQNPYSAVTGSVTYNGQPVPSGEVRLTPDSRSGNSGPAVVCMIRDGKYQTPEQKGVVGGAYQLRIMGYGPAPETDDPTASDTGAPMFKTQTQAAEFPKGEDCVHDITIQE